MFRDDETTATQIESLLTAYGIYISLASFIHSYKATDGLGLLWLGIMLTNTKLTKGSNLHEFTT